MNNTVHLCDCMDYMKGLPDNAFDLAIVDPPYGIGVDGVNPIQNKSMDQNHEFDHSKQWDKAIPEKAYFTEVSRVSSNQIIWGGNYFLDYLGFCKAPIVWDKLNGGSMFADGEMAWTSRNLPRNLRIYKHQWCGAFKSSERGAIKIHPTQKPIALYKWLLQNYAKPGQTIFDSHVGSGSIRIACHDMGYDFTGCELDPDYHAAQEDRFNTHKAQGQLFDPVELTKNEYVQVAL